MHIAWVTVSGWSRPTHQKTIQSRRVSRRHVVELRNVWQEWDAVRIARVRLADRTRDLASDLSKTVQSRRVSRRHVVELRNVWQEWDALHIARVRLAERKRDLASYMTMRGRNRTRRMSRAVRLAAHDVR